MGYIIALAVIWVIGVIGVISEKNNPSIGKLESHEKLRVTGLIFIAVSIISSLPAIAIILLALKLGL